MEERIRHLKEQIAVYRAFLREGTFAKQADVYLRRILETEESCGASPESKPSSRNNSTHEGWRTERPVIAGRLWPVPPPPIFPAQLLPSVRLCRVSSRRKSGHALLCTDTG